jgi:hypothetical protein
MATTTTRIYIPAIYRPIFRLLQAKTCWLQIAFSMPPPIAKKNAPHAERLTLRARYEVWHDGAMRNLIYYNSIRESFFHWIEITYYRGRLATGKHLAVKKMVRARRCTLIETWMMHELLINKHDEASINTWMSNENNADFWNRTGDVFRLGEHVRPHYRHQI